MRSYTYFIIGFNCAGILFSINDGTPIDEILFFLSLLFAFWAIRLLNQNKL